ncbi:hypothetical protein BVC71_11935 [Marivivens niveibacter]|uniref:DUF3971 domain-containing protein n=1 Tax=Marivivens niveibacter TaxID=1930667 RepID=A0A251WVX4_9RHOB|nr:hypothetical protein [Marivivens niveibacter]OUD08640.1 hypothetical protein BVC71_11935 [Marivivens niveibacter]
MDQGQGDTDQTSGRRRIGRGWLLRVSIALIVAPLIVAVVAVLAILDREISAPHWIEQRLEQSGSQMMSGGSVEIGQVWLTLGRDLHLRARVENAQIRDGDHQTIAVLPVAETLISPRGLVLKQEVLVQEVVLRGAQIGLLRSADGSVEVSFQSNGPRAGAADSWVDLLDMVDQLLEEPALEALETVRAEGVIVNYSDLRSARSYTVDGGTISLDLRGGVVSLRGEFALLSGRPFVTTVDMSYDSPKGRRAATLGLTVANGIAADLAAQVPVLGWMSVVDAPINASIRASVQDDAQLGPMFASFEIQDGVIQPTPESRPIPIRNARSYLSYDPQSSTVRFDRVTADTSWGGFTATGRAYLRDWNDAGWPQSFEGQFEARDIGIAIEDVYDAPRVIDSAAADMRLRLSPFQIDIGQFNIAAGEQVLNGDGTITADQDGWGVALDVTSDAFDAMTLMPFWPETLKTPARNWFADNMTALDVRDLTLGLRMGGAEDMRIGGSTWVEYSQFRPNPQMPYIDKVSGFVSLLNNRLGIELDQGQSASPQGGVIDIAGSTMVMPDITMHEPRAEFGLKTQSTLTAALAYLDLPQWQFLTKAGRPVTLADGRAVGDFQIAMPFMKGMQPSAVEYQGSAVVRDLRSDQIVPNKTITAAQVSVEFDRETLAISGPVKLGAVPMTVQWSRAIGPDAPTVSFLNGTAVVSELFLDEFNIGLPPGSISGETEAQISLRLENGEAPEFIATSDLQGAGIRIDALNWSKSPQTAGDFEISGSLGPIPQIDRISLLAPGLNLSGSIALGEGGVLERASFDRLQSGRWLDGSVALTGRGVGRPAAIEVASGTIDLRQIDLSGSNDGGAPLSVSLDRVIIAQGIELTQFDGEFDSRGGFSGDFSGYLNGQAAVRGRVDPHNGGSRLRLIGSDGGAVAMAAGLLPNASGEDFELTLTPVGEAGVYDGTLTVKNLQVREAPALAELLNAVSVVGLLQQLSGQGLMFVDVLAEFRLTPDQIIVAQSSAAGPGLGISLDGIYTLATKEMDFQGVLSPLYLLNGIGSVLTRKGEGLIGFNFTLSGTKDALQVGVNPLSALTPGMFREIFRRPPPDLSE